jgi:HEPN domain-containing protein
MSKVAQEWFSYARRDLVAANFNLSGSDELLTFAGFLAQQTVEKAIKGYLIFHGKKISKTHNLAFLIQKVKEVDEELARLLLKMDDLTDFAVKYRYPDAPIKEVTRSDIKAAVEVAQSVYDLILTKIS